MKRPWVLALVTGALGLLYAVMGAQLLVLGGSGYFLAAGIVFLGLALMLARREAFVVWLFAFAWLFSSVWAVGEAGLDLWALLPRLTVLTGLLFWLLLPATRRKLGVVDATWKPPVALLLVIGLFVLFAARSTGYGVQPLADRFVPPAETADEITPENVASLEEKWRYRTGAVGPFKSTPILEGDTLYTCAPANIIIALDAETGAERWTYDPQVEVIEELPFSKNCRGVTYHKASEDYVGECPERIITATTDARLLAVNARTGDLCSEFGDDGTVDLLPGMGEVKSGFYFVTSPATIARGRAIVGGWVMDNIEVNEPSGVVRAFDVLTGEFAWAWDMGRPGNNQQPEEGESYTPGTPNVWSFTSFDDALGLIYVPTGNATPDYFGAHRLPETEPYSSSVVALDVEDGSVRWHFQTVHHDIWDYDVPARPHLTDIRQEDGSIVPAVIVPTKRAELFVLDRRTGEPLYDVEERPVPQEPAEGDWLSPTQPFSIGLPNFRTPDIREEDMWGITPWDHLWCRIDFNRLRYEGHFTPPTVEGSLIHPGAAGGFNWGGVAVHDELQLVVANPMIMPTRVRLVPRDEMPEAHMQPQLGTPYGVDWFFFLSPVFTPCLEPPWGRLAVVDLQTQKLLWNRPIGSLNLGVELPMGLPQIAGTQVTDTGVIFHAATVDGVARAIDLLSGETLWQSDLPGASDATPMLYDTPVSNRQRFVVQVPSGGMFSTGAADEEGGYVIAYGLP